MIYISIPFTGNDKDREKVSHSSSPASYFDFAEDSSRHKSGYECFVINGIEI